MVTKLILKTTVSNKNDQGFDSNNVFYEINLDDKLRVKIKQEPVSALLLSSKHRLSMRLLQAPQTPPKTRS